MASMSRAAVKRFVDQWYASGGPTTAMRKKMTALLKQTLPGGKHAWARPSKATTVFRGGFTAPKQAWSFTRDIRIAKEFDPYQVVKMRVTSKTPALDVRKALGSRKAMAEVVAMPTHRAAYTSSTTVRVKGHRRMSKKGKVAQVRGFTRKRGKVRRMRRR